MSMQQMEIAQNDERTVRGNDKRHSSIGNKGVAIMSTITRTAHGTRFGIGMAAVAAVAVAVFLSINVWSVSTPSAIPAPAAEGSRFSPLPAGLTDYQGLQTERARSNFSALPQGLTDYQGIFTERAQPNFSPVPQGLTDYQEVQTVAPQSNFSPLPAGLTDYQGLGN